MRSKHCKPVILTPNNERVLMAALMGHVRFAPITVRGGTHAVWKLGDKDVTHHIQRLISAQRLSMATRTNNGSLRTVLLAAKGL